MIRFRYAAFRRYSQLGGKKEGLASLEGRSIHEEWGIEAIRPWVGGCLGSERRRIEKEGDHVKTITPILSGQKRRNHGLGRGNGAAGSRSKN